MMAQDAASDPADFDPSRVELTTGYPGRKILEVPAAVAHRFAHAEVAVDLVGRGVDQERRPVRGVRVTAAKLFEELERPERVDVVVRHRIQDRGRHGDLAGQVQDDVERLFESGAKRPGVADVAFDETDVRMHALEPRAVEAGRRAHEAVENDDVVAELPEPPGRIGADETGSAGDQKTHASSKPFILQEDRGAGCRRRRCRNRPGVRPRRCSARAAGPRMRCPWPPERGPSGR